MSLSVWWCWLGFVSVPLALAAVEMWKSWVWRRRRRGQLREDWRRLWGRGRVSVSCEEYLAENFGGVSCGCAEHRRGAVER